MKAEAATIGVEQTSGAPRLEVVDGGNGGPATPPAPSSPAGGSPPPPDAFAPFGDVAGPVEPVRQLWTPAEAASLVTGGHNLAGALLHGRNMELYEAWHADPKELDPQAQAIARVLDAVPFLEPGGAGPLGIVGDLLISVNAVVGLEMRHVLAVREARARVARKVVEHQRSAPPAPTAGPTPPMAPPPDPAAPAAAPDAAPGGGFRFKDDELSFLTGASALVPDDRIRPMEATR